MMADKNFHVLEEGYTIEPVPEGSQSALLTEYKTINGKKHKRTWYYWVAGDARILDPSGPQSDWKEVMTPSGRLDEGNHISHTHRTFIEPPSKETDGRRGGA